jgi:hypothetical protein
LKRCKLTVPTAILSDKMPPSIVFLIQGCKEVRKIDVESAAIKVARLTPAENSRICGRGPNLFPVIKRMVMMKTVALRMAWNPRAISTGTEGEMRISLDR